MQPTYTHNDELESSYDEKPINLPNQFVSLKDCQTSKWNSLVEVVIKLWPESSD